jgi:hypothetical protein
VREKTTDDCQTNPSRHAKAQLQKSILIHNDECSRSGPAT